MTGSPSPGGAAPTPDRLEEAAGTGTTLALRARAFPAETAILAPSGERSFAELDAGANRLARVLRRGGLRAGDAVAIVCSNRPEFAEAVFAALRAGLRYTPVNWHLTAEEVAYIVEDCDARAVIADSRFAATVGAAVAQCSRVEVRLAVGGPIEGFDPYDAALAAESGEDLEDPVLGNRMLYTSGTTGRPKGVLRPPRYSTGLEALTTAPRYRAGTGQLNLCTGPLHHGGPLGFSLVAPLSAGVGVVLMERWDAAGALEMISTHRITHTHMVPTMFHRLLRLPAEVREAADVSSMQYLLHGAAPCPVETKRAMIDWFGPILWEYFAATEGAGASIGPDDWLAHPGSVGRPPTADHLRILDDDGVECAPGVAGTIHLRDRPETAFEYFGAPAKTAAAHRGDYFSVGDMGYVDEAGYLYITDRTAEVIVSGGVNIYPAEVEEVLLTHPEVADAAVIGVPDPEWGERVIGVVTRESAGFRPGGSVRAEGRNGSGGSEECEGSDAEFAAALVELCRERLAGFKCPRRIDVVDTLPRLDNGKLYRNRLRESYRKAGEGER